MKKILTLSHNQAGLIILSLATVVAFGTEADEDNWKLCVDLITRLKVAAETHLAAEDAEGFVGFEFSLEFNEEEIDWLNTAAYFGICYYTIFPNEGTAELISIGKMLSKASYDPDDGLLESVIDYTSKRVPPIADSYEDRELEE